MAGVKQAAELYLSGSETPAFLPIFTEIPHLPGCAEARSAHSSLPPRALRFFEGDPYRSEWSAAPAIRRERGPRGDGVRGVNAADVGEGRERWSHGCRGREGEGWI